MKEVEELLAIVESLRKQYEQFGLRFSLDGKLVGDIGEVLAAQKYGLTLFPGNHPLHDGQENATGRLIQIKSSMNNRSYFPCRHGVPHYYIAIQILPNGEIDEIFNGPGGYIQEHYIEARGLTNNDQYVYTLSGQVLREFNVLIPANEKIQLIE
jgi:hypothetical protein